MAAEAGDDGEDAADLFIGVHRGGTGAGGLAADVDDVGAFGDELETVLDGAAGVAEVAAVGEGIGRDIEDAHDQ